MNICKQLSLVLILLFSIGTNIAAQLTPSDFLLTAFEDNNAKEFDAKLAFLNKGTYRLPYGDEIEFRYSNDERSLEDARYRLRLSPSNPWLIRRNNALFNALKKEISLEQQIVYNENLFDRYSMLIDYLFTFKETKLLEQRYLLAARKLRLFQENPQSDFFDPRDYVDIRLETIERLEDLEESHTELLKREMEIKLFLNTDEIDWDNFVLITAVQITELIPQIISTPAKSSELLYIQQQMEVAKAETAKERADFDIGFIEARFSPNVDDDETKLGFAFGFTIPIFNPNKDQIAERVLDEIELKNELNTEEFKDSVFKVIEYQFLQDQLIQHQKLEDNIDEIDMNALSQNLAISEEFNPIVQLDLEVGKLKLQQLKMRSQKRVLEQFIEVLFRYNALQSNPLKNYLHKDLEIIE